MPLRGPRRFSLFPSRATTTSEQDRDELSDQLPQGSGFRPPWAASSSQVVRAAEAPSPEELSRGLYTTDLGPAFVS